MRANAEITEAPPLDPRLVTDGMGRDAWRFLKRLSEPMTIVRAARPQVQGAPPVVQVIGHRVGRWRVFLEACPAALGEWLENGWVEPLRRVPGQVVAYGITPAGRAAEAKLRPDFQHEARAGEADRRDLVESDHDRNVRSRKQRDARRAALAKVSAAARL